MIRTLIAAATLAIAGCSTVSPPASSPQSNQDEVDPRPRAVIETALGDIVVALEDGRAPITVANFIMHAQAGTYEDGSFYRSVRDDTDRPNVAPMNLIQGGTDIEGLPDEYQIAHEPTSETGLTHKRAAISMGRYEVGTATAEFFIMVADYPGLDAGPDTRNPDGEGYAVFGEVVEGMEVVEAIWQSPTGVRNAPRNWDYPQFLDEPVTIERVRVLN